MKSNCTISYHVKDCDCPDRKINLVAKLKTLQPLDMAEPDPCCSKALNKALSSGSLNEKSKWIHEKCGCRWAARQMSDGSRYWYPVVEVWII